MTTFKDVIQFVGALALCTGVIAVIAHFCERYRVANAIGRGAEQIGQALEIFFRFLGQLLGWALIIGVLAAWIAAWIFWISPELTSISSTNWLLIIVIFLLASIANKLK